jgi:DNA-binding CsgD family transcriptional regulator
MWPGLTSTLHYAVVLCEAQAGTLDRARALLAAWPAADAPQATAMRDLAVLEVATGEGTDDAGAFAQEVYDGMHRRRFAYAAGVAAVLLARAGRGAPPVPAWLAGGSPVRVLWEWSAALSAGDATRLRAVAGRLAEMALPYESALALRDASDLGAAYRALSAIGAGEVRRQVAERLRAEGRPIPRRTRAEVERDGLTEAERVVVRLVAGGARSEDAAERLGISVRTVDSHLARIYRKTGQRGRVALATWWTQRELDATRPPVPHKQAPPLPSLGEGAEA